MAGLTLALLLVTIHAVTGSVAEPEVYNGASSTDVYGGMYTLQKPGHCKSHPNWPETIQCAETRRCISFAKEFNNSKCDCCGPDKNCQTCNDHSDEDRVVSPGGPECKGHPHYPLVWQCAKNHSICLSRLTHWNNGQCDCCPEQNFVCSHPNCTDHSDEECLANEWKLKFSCDGNCIAIKKFDDEETDCFSDCTIENNDTAKSGCESKKTESAAKGIEEFCTMMTQKNTPYFRCTSGDKQCIPAGSVRDNRQDCQGGEDEDVTLHSDCPASVKSSKCDPGVVECVLVGNKAENADCRCKAANSGSNVMDNCNKDRPQRRRRIFK